MTEALFQFRFQRGYYVDSYVRWTIWIRLFGREFFFGAVA